MKELELMDSTISEMKKTLNQLEAARTKLAQSMQEDVKTLIAKLDWFSECEVTHLCANFEGTTHFLNIRPGPKLYAILNTIGPGKFYCQPIGDKVSFTYSLTPRLNFHRLNYLVEFLEENKPKRITASEEISALFLSLKKIYKFDSSKWHITGDGKHIRMNY